MDIVQRATPLLRPFMAKGRRDTWLTLAFHGEHRDIYDAIDQDGATTDFTVRCVKDLRDRGCVGSRHALSLLLESVRGDAGSEHQSEFQALIDELDSRCANLRPTLSAARNAVPPTVGASPPASATGAVAAVPTPAFPGAPLPPASDGSATARRDFFVSYNKADKDWAVWIAWQLERAGYSTFIEDWDFLAGGNFVMEMDHAAKMSRRTIAVLSNDYLAAQYTQSEWAAAFAQDPTGAARVLVPVRVRACRLEGLLRALTYVDLLGRDEAAAKKTLLARVSGERLKPSRAPGFPGDAAAATAGDPRFPGQVADETVLAQPLPVFLAGTAPQENEIEREEGSLPKGITRIDEYGRGQLIGREAELQCLTDAWQQARSDKRLRPKVLSLIAQGGEGKTTLVVRWAIALLESGWPDCEACFAWSFYKQGTEEQSAASSDLFLIEALTAFGDKETADSAQGPEDKGRRLARLVGRQRTLLILDGLEPLQEPPSSCTAGQLKDRGIREFLKALVADSRGLCLVTSRYEILDLRSYSNSTKKVELTRLSTAAGVDLLRKLGVWGQQGDFERLVEDVRGHALTLNLLGTYLRDAHAGDIRRRDRVNLERADAEKCGHAFRVIAAYERWMVPSGFWAWLRALLSRKERDLRQRGRRTVALLRLLGLFDRPAIAECIDALLRKPPIAGLTEAPMLESELNLALSTLIRAKLVTVERDSAGNLVLLDAHPLVRAYFAKQLRECQPQAFEQAHARLYERLSQSKCDQQEDPTISDLQPLYQAVAHGCLAGRLQDAYEVLYVRIERKRAGYSLKKRGAFASDLGAITYFCADRANPWAGFSDGLTEPAKSHLWLRAGFCLRALGCLAEAGKPIKAGLGVAVKLEDWEGASIGAGSLSQLELVLGNVSDAVAAGETAVACADKSAKLVEQLAKRTIHAEALHQAGRRSQAEERFQEAEALQAQRQPDQPLLHSLWGFRYCEMLLAPAECAAWRATLAIGRGADTSDSQPVLATIAAVREHTEQWAGYRPSQEPLVDLDASLERLAYAQVLLFEAILADLPPGSLQRCRGPLNQAVDGLRRAGQQDHLPRGLLPRAWWLFLSGCRTEARADLDEAWEIAARGPMPLFTADILLTRARLFGPPTRAASPSGYPWESPDADLVEARRLITKHGYHRRDEELKATEFALARRSEQSR